MSVPGFEHGRHVAPLICHKTEVHENLLVLASLSPFLLVVLVVVAVAGGKKLQMAAKIVVEGR